VVSTTFDGFLKMLTPDVVRLLERARACEDRGDFSAALRLLRRTPRPTDSAWERELAEMAALGDKVDTWRFGRWLLNAAARWTASDVAMAHLVDVATDVARTASGPREPEYAGWVSGRAALRTLVQDYALFEFGLLDEYLRSRIAPELAVRAGPVEEWPDSSTDVFVLDGLAGAQLTVKRFGDAEPVAVRHLGEAVGLGRESLVYGRLVPTLGDPGRMFAMPPIAVDEAAAARLLRLAQADEFDPDRFRRLCEIVLSGDPVPVVMGRASEGPPAGRVQDLIDEGLSRQDAEHLVVCEFALMVARDYRDATPVVAYHAGVALAWPRVFAEARRRLATPAHEASWRALAECVHGLERERYLQLADASALAA